MQINDRNRLLNYLDPNVIEIFKDAKNSKSVVEFLNNWYDELVTKNDVESLVNSPYQELFLTNIELPNLQYIYSNLISNNSILNYYLIAYMLYIDIYIETKTDYDIVIHYINSGNNIIEISKFPFSFDLNEGLILLKKLFNQIKPFHISFKFKPQVAIENKEFTIIQKYLLDNYKR